MGDGVDTQFVVGAATAPDVFGATPRNQSLAVPYAAKTDPSFWSVFQSWCVSPHAGHAESSLHETQLGQTSALHTAQMCERGPPSVLRHTKQAPRPEDILLSEELKDAQIDY